MHNLHNCINHASVLGLVLGLSYHFQSIFGRWFHLYWIFQISPQNMHYKSYNCKPQVSQRPIPLCTLTRSILNFAIFQNCQFFLGLIEDLQKWLVIYSRLFFGGQYPRRPTQSGTVPLFVEQFHFLWKSSKICGTASQKCGTAPQKVEQVL